MSDLFEFELISPEEKLVSEAVYLAEIPGDQGMFGVLPGHCSLLSSLGLGVVSLHKSKDGDDVKKFFIAGGFADVTAKTCVVLAEQAIPVDMLNKGELEQQLSDLNEDVGMAEEQVDKERIKNKIAVTKAKLLAVAA